MTNAKILVVDDNKSVLHALEILLQFQYQEVMTISNPNQITSLQDLKKYDLVLLDMNFSAGINTGNEGLYWLREILKRAPEIAIVMMTAYGDIELAVKALKEGAVDFVLKPWNNEKLLATLKSAYELRKSKTKIDQLEKKETQLKQVINQSQHAIIGDSKALRTVLTMVKKVAKTDVNVLITGENGTGKELIARELHQQSSRNEEVFIPVDMGSISENLFESELFGHVKGSFTDAKEDRAGKFEAADGGTLFLDEIGNISLQAQAKLLSAIQNKTVVPVGSNKPIEVDIRLICATNCNLPQMVEDGLFREDLLYRINTIGIEVPPLRKRGEDIVVLANYYLNKFISKYNKPRLRINQPAIDKLLAYPWPGNVRELVHTMERAVILVEGEVLRPDDFVLGTAKEQTVDDELVTLEEMELLMIRKALDHHDGNHSAAADQLGISRQTLYNKLKKVKGMR